MGTRRSWLVFLVLFFPAGARADDHWVDASASYSQAEGFSQLKGGHFAVTVPLGHIDRTAPAKKTKNWNVTADYSFHEGTHDDVPITQKSATLGLRYSLPHKYHKSNVFFLHGIVGRSWTDGSSLDGERWAFGAGLGWEVLPRLSDPPSSEGKPARKRSFWERLLVGYRSQAEVMVMKGDGQNKAYVRYSTGAIIRIGEH